MFNLGAIASNVLNSMDSVAKETIEDIKIGLSHCCYFYMFIGYV